MTAKNSQNNGRSQAGAEKDQQVNETFGTIEDDVSQNYLVSRQLAQELSSPAMAAFKRYNGNVAEEASPVNTQVPESDVTIESIKAEDKPLEEPWLDPVAAFSGGFGGMGTIAARQGAKLLPSLGRALISGFTGAAAEYPIGVATEKIGEEHPKLAFPFNVVTGMLSGTTVETIIEKSVVKALSKGGAKPARKAISAGINQVKEGLESGKIADDITGEVVENLNKQTEQLPLDQVLGDSTTPLVRLAKETDAKAEKFLRADPELPSKYSININFNRINTTDDVKQVIHKTSQIFTPGIQKARRGVRTNEETQKTADMLGITVKDLLARRKGVAFNAEEALSARQILVSSSENLHALAQKANLLEATDIDKFAFRKALNTHYAIQAQVSGMTAEAGRALQSFNISTKSSKVKTKQIKELLEQMPGGVSTERMAAALSAIDTVEGVNRFAKDIQRATTTDMFFEAWINGLLSGPQTHAVNMLSNSLVAAWQIPERLVAAQVGRITGSKAINEGEVVAQTFGLIEGIKDGLKTFTRVLKTGEPSDTLSKIELSKHRAITAENMRELPLVKKIAPNVLQEGGVAARAADLLGEAIRLPGRFLVASDEAFKGIGYRMELNARAYRTAREEGLQGVDAAKRMQSILANPEEAAPDLHLAAIDAARYQTFTKELGLAGVGVQRVINQTPMLRLVAPFVRTPTNIMKFAGERTPFAVLSKNVREEIAAGGARRDMALAKMSMGSMVMATSASLAAAGHITGGGPADSATQAAWRRTGWQPYSLKVGDKYYAYGRLEPLGILFGASADFTEISGLAGEELTPDMEKYATAITAAIAKNVTSKTWLRGFSETVQAFSDQERYSGKYIQRFISSMVPAISAQAERVVDPELEAIYSISDALKSRVPGLSNSLPPRRDLWGEPVTTAVTKDRSWAEIAYSAVSPVYISKEGESPIDDELIRLKEGISKPNRVMTIEGITVGELEPEEYDRFLVLMNKLPLDSTGRTLKSSLNQLVTKDPDYIEAPDERKIVMIKRMFLEARMLAKERLPEEMPIIRYLIDEGRKLKEQQYQ